jgi:hypothetical protein
MPKGQQNQGHQNKPKLTLKEKAAKKAAKRNKGEDAAPLARPNKA